MAPNDFEILSEIRNIEVIAAGRGVRVRHLLSEQFGKGRWRKLKGRALVRERTGETYEAEIHWYEAHGIGRVDWKVKRELER